MLSFDDNLGERKNPGPPRPVSLCVSASLQLFEVLILGPWQSQNLQLLQSGNGIRTGRCGFDLPVDIEERSVFSNVKRPPFSDGSSFMYHTVRLGDFLTWIAENGIVDTKRFSESFVVFRTICAGGKVGDIGVFEGFAILTE